MANGISADSQIHISVALLIKAGILIAIVVGSWYQAQMRFASIEVRLNDMHEELVVLNSKVATMENKHITELEEQNKTLLDRMGLKRK
jgi:uncharacterized protein (UPF0333 family)|tara:strand:- start:153 stop:416 length:264 start_codon:yes stop_codon:yes gene_type:complete